MIPALIPPIGLLPDTAGLQYHLVLHHLLSDKRYRMFYQDGVDVESYVILDNSAHESGAGTKIDELWESASQIGADEVVIPDVLFNSERTVANAQQSFDALFRMQIDLSTVSHLMVVPQGRSRRDFADCFWKLLECWESFHQDRFALTVGLSKDYEVFDGGLYRLLQMLIVPARQRVNFDIHCLGWGRDLWALRAIADDFGDVVRSVDSAKPYVYALDGIALDPTHIEVPPYPRRRPGYFQRQSFSTHELELVQNNISVFFSTARGEITT